MTKKEVLATRVGDMLDMMMCHAIANGSLEEVRHYDNCNLDMLRKVR